MTSKERILDRCKTIALIATTDNMRDQLAAIRAVTRIFLNTLGLVRGEMVAGCYGKGDIIRREALPAMMEEQIAIAKQAIEAAAFMIRIVRGDDAAEEYQLGALAEIEAVTSEDPTESQAIVMEELEQRMAEAGQRQLIDDIFLVARRGN